MAAKERNTLLRQIGEAGFAMDDARIFLDTHKDCREALAYYKNMAAVRASFVEEYECQYGPLSWFAGFDSDSWKWVEYPWPWEGECK